MEIPIPIRKEKLPEFLQYLRSELNKLQGSRGDGGYQEGGIYVERLDVSIQTAQEELVPTTWTFTWNPDGSLDPIKVEANDPPSEAWRESVEGVIRNALAATVNQNKQRFFRRDAFAYIGPNLDGEYWISGKRIAPAIPDDEIDYSSERIIYVDHWVDAVDRRQATPVGMVQAEKIVTLLSLFINIGVYRIPTEKRWVHTGSHESKRFRLGYSSTAPRPTTMPIKGAECQLGKLLPLDRRDYRSRLVRDHLLHLPGDVRKLFRAFQKLNPTQQEVFFNAAALYRVALIAGRNLPTVRVSYQVAAVDALVEGTNHTRRAFVGLVQKYNPKVTIELIEYLYGHIRSAHFHTGQFPLGEYQPIEIEPVSGPEQINRMTLQMDSTMILQPVLIDWLLERANS